MAEPAAIKSHRNALGIQETIEGNFDYNPRINVETGMTGYNDYWVRPIGGVVNQEGPFNFVLDPMPDRYIMLNRAGLEVTLQVTTAEGGELDWIADIVAPINMLGTTMWKQVEVSLNDQPFSGVSSVNAGVKCMMETLLSYDTSAANTHVRTHGYYTDTPGQYSNMGISANTLMNIFCQRMEKYGQTLPAGNMFRDPDFNEAEYNPLNELNQVIPRDAGTRLVDIWSVKLPMVSLTMINEAPTQQQRRTLLRRRAYQQHFNRHLGYYTHLMQNTYVNKGYESRYKIASSSRKFDLYSPLPHDFFKIDNHIAPANKIDIRLTRHSDRFLLNSVKGPNCGYKLKILDMKLHLHCIKRKESIMPPLVETYRMNETQLHKHIIQAGSPSINFRIHHGGVKPKTIVFAFATVKAIDGAYGENPLCFQHFNLKKLQLQLDSETYPANGLNFDFTGDNALVSRAYQWMFENTGAWEGERGNIISYNAFK